MKTHSMFSVMGMEHGVLNQVDCSSKEGHVD